MKKLGMLYLCGLFCLAILFVRCNNQSSSSIPNQVPDTSEIEIKPSTTIHNETPDSITPQVVVEKRVPPPPPPKRVILDLDTDFDSLSFDSTIVTELPFDSSLVIVDTNELEESDTIIITETSAFEEVEIIREELLASYQVELPSKDTSTSNTRIDSILSKQSDIQITQKKSVTIEFWDHPLYSSQYSMNGKVLKLYGVVPDETVLIQPYENQNYLLVNGAYFAIKNSFSLRPLAAESDSFIIYQLQEN